MIPLIKYEFRKTRFSKLIMLAVTAIAEAAYLLGVFMDWERFMVIGITGLSLCGVIGIFYIGVESLTVFHKDLNTKQSYMLFLTPRSSYQILGAKVIENGISIFLTGAFYAALAALDMTVGILYIGGLKEFLDILQQAARYISLEIEVHPQDLLLVLGSMLAFWLMQIVIGNLAIVLSATVFAGKKYSGIVSFALYLLICWGVVEAMAHLTPLTASGQMEAVFTIAESLLASGLMCWLTGWIMERKLSV